MKKVSIIMPAYNAEKDLERSIDSVLNQEYKNLELIIINDGSIDNTAEIVKKIQLIDERVKYFEIENSGSAVARNIGLDNATGDYIGFVDSDDFVDKEMYKVLINKAEKYSCDIVSASYVWIFPNQIKPEKTYLRNGLFEKKDMINEVYPNIFSSESLKDIIPKTMWTKIFRRELIESNCIKFVPELRMSQDVIFSIKCMLNAKSFYYLPNEKFYKYVSNKNSRTNTYLSNSWIIMKQNYEQLKNMSKEFPQYSLNAQLPYSILRNAMTAIANEGRNDKSISAKQRITSIKTIVNDYELIEAINFLESKNFSIIRKILTKLIVKKKVFLLYIGAKLYN